MTDPGDRDRFSSSGDPLPPEISEEDAIELVKLLSALAGHKLPNGHLDDYADENDPHLTLRMNSTFNVNLFADGYALIDGGELTAGELAHDILSLLTVFRHYQATGIIE